VDVQQYVFDVSATIEVILLPLLGSKIGKLMPLHPTLERVTERVVERSAPSRDRYLARMLNAKSQGPARRICPVVVRRMRLRHLAQIKNASQKL